MHAICTAVLAAACSLVPVVTSAQSSRPATPDLPTSLFSEVFRGFVLTDPNPLCASGLQPCFSGAAAWGQLAGTTGPLGYALVLDLRVGPPVRPGTRVGPDFYYGAAVTGDRFEPFEFDGGSTGSGLVQASGGKFPAYYVEGAPPFAFELQTVGVEYGYYDPFGNPNITDARLVATSVPEPATLALTLAGLAVLGVGAWRRRRAF